MYIIGFSAIFHCLQNTFLFLFSVVKVDFMQLMINASVDESSEHEAGDSKVNKKSLTDEEVVSMANVFIQAGFETTSNLLGFTAYLLALNPDKQEMLLTKIDEYYAENEEVFWSDIMKLFCSVLCDFTFNLKIFIA